MNELIVPERLRSAAERLKGNFTIKRGCDDDMQEVMTMAKNQKVLLIHSPCGKVLLHERQILDSLQNSRAYCIEESTNIIVKNTKRLKIVFFVAGTSFQQLSYQILDKQGLGVKECKNKEYLIYNPQMDAYIYFFNTDTICEMDKTSFSRTIISTCVKQISKELFNNQEPTISINKGTYSCEEIYKWEEK